MPKARSELSAREVEALHETLTRRMGDSSVPTLPEVAVKVIQLVNDPNASLKHFADAIGADPALTGRLLRTANSAYYAQRQPVTQLHRAMVLLGIDRLKAMALGFHLTQAAAANEDQNSTKQVWTQSLFRAWLAFRIAEMFDRRLSGEAFIVGLMLDAGIPMMGELAGEQYPGVVAGAQGPTKAYAAEFKGLPFTHVDVAAALCRMWKLPPTLARPICLHHSPAEPVREKDPVSLLHAVACYVGSLHLDSPAGDPPSAPLAMLAQRLFAISTPDLQKLLRNAASDFKASKEMFADVLDPTMTVEKILQSANRELNEAVEGLVEQAIDAETGARVCRFEAEGMVLEFVPAHEHRVTVYLADGDGNRLLSEDVDPRQRSQAELRQMLMLDSAPDAMANEIVGKLIAMAA
ncbi:MAG TPA: hypothetical protein DEB06_10680 [Phycisphaerales bacterium]|nr:hypothetical protein [Phycisphaerales bacterium]